MEFKINEEYEQLLPVLSDEEITSLKQSIEKSGIRVKLQVLEDGTILCGHNRYRLATELKLVDIPYEIVDISDENIESYIIEDNLFRRQLNTAWKVQLAEKLEEIEIEKAKQRQARKSVKVDLPEQNKGQSRDKVAEKLGVSGSTYAHAKKVKETDPKLWEKALNGDLTVDGAYKAVKKEEQKKLHEDVQKETQPPTEKKKTGTREWSDYSLNINKGCKNNCKYCYAKWNAVNRYKTVASQDEWETIEKLKTQNVKKQDGVGMFPTTHDITPENVDDSILFLEKHMKIGNKILITSKPHLECVKRICDSLLEYKDKITFRFTIGSISDEVLRFWEPGAPSYSERMESLKYAFENGFQTSVSCEPILDKSISLVVCKASPYVTQTIWLGKMNDVGQRVDINNWEHGELCFLKMIHLCNNKEFVLELYDMYKNNPQIRWKDSFKEVLGLPQGDIE